MNGGGVQGAVGSDLATAAAIEIKGRATANTTVEVYVSRDGRAFTLLGSTRALPPTDPYLQPKPSQDGTSPFSLRVQIPAEAGYVFRVKGEPGAEVSAQDLVLKDLRSGKQFHFEAED